MEYLKVFINKPLAQYHILDCIVLFCVGCILLFVICFVKSCIEDIRIKREMKKFKNMDLSAEKVKEFMIKNKIDKIVLRKKEEKGNDEENGNEKNEN